MIAVYISLSVVSAAAAWLIAEKALTVRDDRIDARRIRALHRVGDAARIADDLACRLHDPRLVWKYSGFPKSDWIGRYGEDK